jgi:hypothetical protein
VLIDVSAVAREPGIRYPVALTRTAWEQCVAVPSGVVCQDEAGRLWDAVYMLRLAIGRSNGGIEVRFGLILRRVRGGSRNRSALPVEHRQPDHDGEGSMHQPRQDKAKQAGVVGPRRRTPVQPIGHDPGHQADYRQPEQ